MSQNITEGNIPADYQQMGPTIRLYHGTDVQSLYDILSDREIDASKGEQHGETHGMNWFFTQPRGNFSRGVLFSFLANRDEFQKGTFHFMSSSVVASYRPIGIDGRDFTIERIGSITKDDMKGIYGKCGNDIFKLIKYINTNDGLLSKYEDTQVDSPINLQILLQTFGISALKKYGIMESHNHLNEVSASDINLKSFKVQDELNPKIWANNKLNSRVRLRLLDIADDFIDDLSVSWVKPMDIVLTGSIANYNWSRYSDIDLHIIIDYGKVYKKKEFVEDYFDSKKELWKRDHDSLKIYGYPVEVYVQDKSEKDNSNGVYSLISNKWIKEPKDIDDAKINADFVKRKAAMFMTQIDELDRSYRKEKGSTKVEGIGNKAKKILDKLKGIRKEGLSRSGEMSSGNVIYKIIRRMGYLDKIWDVINNTYNKSKSLT